MLVEWLAVAGLSAALVVVLILARVTTRADSVVYDALSRAAAHAPLDDIVIVGIDNRSVGEVGRWPWPRARHAELLQQLSRAGAKAIAYDVLFVEPDRQTEDDVALAAAIRQTPPTYLPLTFETPGANGAPFDVTPPVPLLAQAAAGLGQVNVAFDEDGAVRRTFLSEGGPAQRWPHLMQRLAQHAAHPPLPRNGGTSARPHGAPTDGLLRSDPVMIAFAGPAGTFRTVSAVDVLRGETPPQLLRGKLVLVGATADGLGDQYSTPMSGGGAMSGVELQANLLETLIDGRAITALSPAVMIPLSLAPLGLLLFAFLRLSPRANMVLGLALLGAVLGLCALMFLQWRIWAPPVPALTGLLAAYPLWSWRRLEASSAYMLDELKQFSKEPDVWAALSPDAHQTGDRIERQVTLLRRAIGRARDARTFVTDTLQGLPDAVLVVGPDGKIAFANRQAVTLFYREGAPPLVGSDLAGLTAPLGALSSRILPAAGAAAPGEQIELQLSGQRTFAVGATPLRDADRRVAAHIVRFTDITQLKAASEEREQVLQLLTHDMRSPQVSILTLLDHAETQALPRPFAAKIAGYARRTLSLADNFVHLARAEQSILDMGVVDLRELLIDAVDDLWPQSSARTIAIDIAGCDGERLVAADRGLLTRALINLLGNAIKFTEPGGRVTCCWEPPETPGDVVLSISDNGCGMSDHQRDHLFEPFVRAPGAAAAQTDGVGLGLSFVRAVIARHAGDISCESQLGVGTTFAIRLPLSPQDAEAAEI